MHMCNAARAQALSTYFLPRAVRPPNALTKGRASAARRLIEPACHPTAAKGLANPTAPAASREREILATTRRARGRVGGSSGRLQVLERAAELRVRPAERGDLESDHHLEGGRLVVAGESQPASRTTAAPRRACGNPPRDCARDVWRRVEKERTSRGASPPDPSFLRFCRTPRRSDLV
eukprot:5094336-Prymnesium_polylepis.1